MVNEINKPCKENTALSERLAASNRQLREMQEEHRRLLLEMQTLRQRATELGRLNALQIERPPQPPAPEIDPAPIENVTEEVPTNSSTTSEPTEEANSIQQEEKATDKIDEAQKPLDAVVDNTPETVEDQPSPVPESTDNKNNENASDEKVAAEEDKAGTDNKNNENASDEEVVTEEDKAGTAAYLQEKLAEIARLKSQFKRVQNLIDTTKVIEQHIAAKETTKAELVDSKAALQSAVSAVDATPAPVTSINTTSDVNNTLESNVTQSLGELSVDAAENDEHSPNRELLDTMYNLFTDFTSDLRGQADSLRAERDRIKALRDEILSRRQQK